MDKETKKEKKETKLNIEIKVKEILERTATNFGTGAHVIVPKEYSGKKLKIILEDDDEVTKTKRGGKKDE